jgi:hypothetical protein
MAEGTDSRNLLKQYPEIARAYDLYVSCRSQDLVIAEIPKGDKTFIRITPKTTGYAVLPLPGGMLDQPYRLMEFMSHFRTGDQMATKRALS